jgi:hypothetical protein
MRGDFSRIRPDRRGYAAVLEQQGRVALDADANEQVFIDAYRSRTQTIDAVGQCGGPAGDAGFQVTVTGNEILIGPGRYYVNGLLCENPASLSYDDQPYLVNPSAQGGAASLLSQLSAAAGTSVLQVWLQVWQRLQTALDDPCLREPALGQADTTGRLQTVWRVVADLAAAPPAQPSGAGPASPCQQMYPPPAPPTSTGTMAADTSGPAAECGCGPVAAAGYQGVENQLYRVEIHTGGEEGRATFKWSRENGSVVAAVTKVSGSTVTVSSLGPDANLGFQPGNWVELTDDTFEFGPAPNIPGPLFQILSTNQADLSVTLAVPPGQAITADPSRNARMRRWDQSGPAATATGIPLSAGSWIQLENGIQVMFDPPGNRPGPVLRPPVFHSGDYWTIPARSATGQIEWPPCGSSGNQAQHPTSVQVYTAPLACLRWVPPSQSSGPAGVVPADCRQMFSPLTAIAPPATIEAAHVTGINWTNDDVMTLDALLADGLIITLDRAPTCPLSGTNVIVTLELPQPQPGSVSLRTVTVFDATVALNGSAITWQPPVTIGQQLLLIQDLNAPLLEGALNQSWAKARIRLPGQIIYAAGPAGLAYLDGLALGQPGVRHDGVTPRIDLKLPSGAGVTATDFEGWLYVAPVLQVTGVTVTNPAVTVMVGPLRVTGVFVTGSSPPEVVSPDAVITVSYPVIADTTVTIVVLNTDGSGNGVGTIVSVPGTATIPRGQTSVTIPVSVVGNPGIGPTGAPIVLSFTITASVVPQIGRAVAATAATPFSVTGVAALLRLPPVSE